MFAVCSLPSIFVSSILYAGNAMTSSVIGACLVGLLLFVLPLKPDSSYLDADFIKFPWSIVVVVFDFWLWHFDIVR